MIDDNVFDPVMPLYWDRLRQTFWASTDDGTWYSLPTNLVRSELRGRGLRPRAIPGENRSQVDDFISETHRKRGVNYAAPLAGYGTGFRNIEGIPCLITEGPKLLKPTPGDWKIIKEIVVTMLGP